MFYTIWQNNARGQFDVHHDIGIGHRVTVEADDEDEAKVRLDAILDYYDTHGTHGECSCCGRRWSDWGFDEEGEQPPASDGATYKQHFIHYQDGRIVMVTAVAIKRAGE